MVIPPPAAAQDNVPLPLFVSTPDALAGQPEMPALDLSQLKSHLLRLFAYGHQHSAHTPPGSLPLKYSQPAIY
jgi:hypothetical protein